MISLCWAQYCCVNAHQLEWTPDYKNARETTDWAGMFLRAVVALLNAPAAQVPKHTDAPFRNRCTFSCAQLIDMAMLHSPNPLWRVGSSASPSIMSVSDSATDVFDN